MHAQLTRTRRRSRSGLSLAWRAGFTLIELMVVILIIAILAGFLLVAVWGAQSTAQDARTILELDQMAQALEAYKSKYGEYPPIGIPGPVDGAATDTPAEAKVRAHLARAFPRFITIPGDMNDPVPALAALTPDQALVFWLGGMPIGSGGGYAVEGFSANVGDPFRSTSIGGWRNVSGPAEPVQRTQPFFNFDPTRLRLGQTPSANSFFLTYVPHGKNTPYVYFPSDQYAFGGAPYQYTFASGDIAVPYKANTTAAYALPTTWINPRNFQIIAAGADDLFGGTQDRTYPIGTGYSEADEDNLTNFSGKRLSKARP